MTVYYIFVLLTFVYFFAKYVHDVSAILVVLCFYAGLANFYGGAIENGYKIILVVVSAYLILKTKPFNNLNNIEKRVLIVFFIFSLHFFLSAFLNGTYFNLTFSQYSKYLVPFILFFVFQTFQKNNLRKVVKFKNMLISLLQVQVILAVIKMFTIGIQEWVVGGISNTGGGVATPLPILGFILIWLRKKGRLTQTDWLFTASLLFIGFVSLKRAVWFMMPLMIFLFMVYVPRKKVGYRVLWFIPLSLFIFYLGVRLDPTLNREHKRWGSFDLDYALNYTQEYTFGKNEGRYLTGEVAEGRGGVTMMLFRKLRDPASLSWKDFFGYGLEEIATRNYETFDQDKFNVHSKGSVTGIFRNYISTGFIGILTYVFYLLSLLYCIRENRIRNVFIGFVFWDYLFYSGIIITNQALAILFLFIIVYTNFQQKMGGFSFLKKRITPKQGRAARKMQPAGAYPYPNQ